MFSSELIFFIQKDFLEVHSLLLEKLRSIICRTRIDGKTIGIIPLHRLRFPNLVLVLMHYNRARRL